MANPHNLTLEEQIVTWSQQLPAWQRVLLAHIVQGSSFSEESLQQLIDRTISDHAIEDVDLNIDHFATSSPAAPPVGLRCVSNLQHVNAISSEMPLTICKDGLTIIYGDNASGKSGYARLLNRIATSRKTTEVLTDVFQDTQEAVPSAKIGYFQGDDHYELDWNESKNPRLPEILFYDSSCGQEYVESEAEFPYRPHALFAMDGLINACMGVQELVNRRLERNSQEKNPIPVIPPEVLETASGTFISKLSPNSRIKDLDKHLKSLNTPEMSEDSLKSQLSTLRSSDTKQAKQTLTRAISKLDTLCKHVNSARDVFSEEKIRDLKGKRASLQEVKKASAIQAEDLTTYGMSGIGNEAWRTLWEAARKFADQFAYTSKSFPNFENDDRCVLCLQPLNESGVVSMQRLDQFVQDELQKKVDEIQLHVKQRLDACDDHSLFDKSLVEVLNDLRESYPVEVQTFEQLVKECKSLMQKVMHEVEWPSAEGLPLLRFTELFKVLASASAQAKQHIEDLADPGTINQRIEYLTRKLAERNYLSELKNHRNAIVHEIHRLDQQRRLEELKAACNTAGITRKIKSLSEETITAVVRNQFDIEREWFKLDRVEITKTRASRGAVLLKAGLEGVKQNATLNEVFSEGERRALGLIGFFTEASLQASKSAMILDDPVTSLDHIRRGRVAQRVIDFACSRQVLVFTHDIAFVSELKKAASEHGVMVTERSVSQTLSNPRRPGEILNSHPWKAKDVPTRIDELKNGLKKIIKLTESKTCDQQSYEEATANWAGMLSETWERIFSLDIVGAILTDGGMEVRPKLVRILVHFSDVDFRQFDASYSKVSTWARRHDKSVHLNYVAPTIDELERELDQLEQWYDRVKKYKSIS